MMICPSGRERVKMEHLYFTMITATYNTLIRVRMSAFEALQYIPLEIWIIYEEVQELLKTYIFSVSARTFHKKLNFRNFHSIERSKVFHLKPLCKMCQASQTSFFGVRVLF